MAIKASRPSSVNPPVQVPSDEWGRVEAFDLRTRRQRLKMYAREAARRKPIGYVETAKEALE